MQSRYNLDIYMYRYKFIFFTARLLSLDTLILHSSLRSAVKMATQISVGDLVGVPQCQCYMHCSGKTKSITCTDDK